MKGAHWLGLLLLLAALAAAVAYLSARRGGDVADVAGVPLLPDLERRFDSLDAIVLRSASERLRLERRDGEWGVEQRHGYAADLGRLSDLLTDLSEMRRKERKTARADNHELLELLDPAAAATGDGADDAGYALRVDVFADGDVYASLLFGAESSSRAGLKYFRHVGEDQTWLVAPGLENASMDPAAWLRQPLLSIESARLRQLVFSSDGEELQRLQRDNASVALGFTPPAGFRLKKDADLSAAARMLEDLRMEDVLSEEEAEDFLPYREISALCFDGLGVVLSIGESADGVSTLMSLKFISSQPESADEAERAARIHDGWVYALTLDSAENLNFDAAELIEPIPDGERATPAATDAPRPVPVLP